MRKLKPGRLGALFALAFMATASGGLWFQKNNYQRLWNKQDVSGMVASSVAEGNFPESVPFSWDGQEIRNYHIEYAVDAQLQAEMKKLLEQYHPDYGAFVALDADTGRVLAIVSYAKNDREIGNLALQARFPAASIFKVITAAAAMDGTALEPDSMMSFNGAPHTLYKRNVDDTRVNRWTRFVTLKEAFAKSINTVFGKIGAFHVGSAKLRDYAERFQFNSHINFEVPAQLGVAMPATPGPLSDFHLAEIASGYNRESRLSPLHGALIAAAIANDGVMPEPYLVERVSADRDGAAGETLYRALPSLLAKPITSASAAEMRVLMQETVARGTSRKSFRKLPKLKRLEDLEIGGKTGSLMADQPRGKCDWFIGYARTPDTRIAVAALTVNIKQWTVKSSYLAGRFIELYYGAEGQGLGERFNSSTAETEDEGDNAASGDDREPASVPAKRHKRSFSRKRSGKK